MFKHLILTSICGTDSAPNLKINRNCSEAEDLVLELADRTSLGVSERLGSLLHSADHRRRTTHEDLDVAGGGREALL